MGKTKGTFHVLKNFQPMNFRSPWWIIGNFFGNGNGERLKNEVRQESKWRKEKGR